MEKLLQDLRYSIRMLFKNPSYTAVALLTLALGIGANTAIFSVVNGVLLRPLSFNDPDRLALIGATNREKGIATHHVSYLDALDWKAQSQSFDDIGLMAYWTFNLTEVEEPEHIQGALATPNLFQMLGKQPMLGRAFISEEAQPGKDNVVILGYGLWQRRFGADKNIIGQKLTLNGTVSTVIGVVGADFGYPYNDVDIWGPFVGEQEQRGSRWLLALARLREGVTPKQAQADLDTIAGRLELSYPDTNAGWGVSLISLHEQITQDVRPALLVLLGAVGLVLLIACANVATLTLARATSRRKEIAIRTAMGATRRRIIRQLLTESIILSLLGGILGTLASFWVIDSLVAFAPDNIPRLNEVSVDWLVLGFTLTVSLLTGALCGLAPALLSSSSDVHSTLKEESGAIGGASRHRLRSLLVVSEVSLSLVLLVGAGLLIQSFLRVQRIDAGFNPENLLTMQLMLTGPEYGPAARRQAFVDETLTRIEALPGVKSASAISTLPIGATSGRVNFSFVAEGRQVREGQDPNAYYRSVSPGYFQTMSIALAAGRYFTGHDNETAQRVAIINRRMAQRIWPDQDPVGKRVRWSDGPWSSGEPQWMTIVGVVADVKQYGLEREEELAIYVPYAQKTTAWRWLAVVVRTDAEPASLSRAVTGEIHAVDRNLPVYLVQPMEKILSESLGARRFNTLLLGVLAALALTLAALGIYSVISYSVSQRTREIGIRTALGAQKGDILRLVLRQGLGLTLVGVVGGLIASVALTRLLSILLYGISATDALTFTSVAMMLMVVALLACYIPARRATKVDPMVALRNQ